MGVYIKGLKMPKDCRECPFEGYHVDIGQTYCMACLKVLATAFKPISFDGRSKWCPLVELESINAKTDYLLIADDARSEALDMAISALRALDEIYAFIMKAEASETTDGVLEIFDALEAQELKQEAKDSKESSLTQKALDTISRQAAIDALDNIVIWEPNAENGLLVFKGIALATDAVKELPSVTQEPCEDTVSRKAAINSACENDAAKRLNDLIFDVNPDEICEQIKFGNLKDWCVTMQTEMGMALIQLPCWEKEKDDE